MKNSWMKALALLLAMTLAIVTIALAEENAATGDIGDEVIEVIETEPETVIAEIEPAAEELGEIDLGDVEDTLVEEEPAAVDDAQDADWDAVQTWWFLVGDTVVATQEARDGDEILQPEDPVAPEGMIFDGWYLEDGTRLFAEEEPVIASPDLLISDMNVFARFIIAEEPAAEEAATEEAAVEETAVEEPVAEEPATEELVAEEPVAEEPATEELVAEEPVVEEPAVEEPVAEDPAEEEAIEPSPDGEGGATAPEEVSLVLPTPNALTYTGEAQALVSGEGWLYSLDGENYSEEIPAAVNAGEYTVYFKAAEAAEPQTLAVTVEKANVVFTAPVAATGEE